MIINREFQKKKFHKERDSRRRTVEQVTQHLKLSLLADEDKPTKPTLAGCN